MRLIDADAFADFLKDTVKRQKYENTKIDGLLTVADVIDAVISELDGTSLDGFKNAPTIEPDTDTISRRKGEWRLEPLSPYHLYCSACGHRLPNDEYIKTYNIHMNFCPNCGARME